MIGSCYAHTFHVLYTNKNVAVKLAAGQLVAAILCKRLVGPQLLSTANGPARAHALCFDSCSSQGHWATSKLSNALLWLMQAANVLQVRVLKTAGGRIQLTQKSEDERKQQSDMSESGIGAGSSKKARNTLEAALAKVGFKHTPEPESEVTWLFCIGKLLLASGLYVCVHQPETDVINMGMSV